MSHLPKFSLSKYQTPTSQVNLHTCELQGTSYRQMAESQTKEGRDICFSQPDSNTFNLRTAALNRRHSADGPINAGADLAPERGPAGRFHPYRRQFSDGEVGAAGCLQQCSSSFSSLQELCNPDTRSHSNDVRRTWNHYNDSVQSSYPELPAVPVEPSSFHPQSYPSFSSLSPLQQISSKLFPNDDQPNGSKYSVQSLSTPSHQECTPQSLFPKPIYSYSILIYMALMNSKTGSLPVSEIYSFMTEHFPYFKTAPDGWKNSVRHNLSLNKCFEKVENKNGNTSRKGCLWALNPAKVEKMQEELHKWRRKDPLTVRRSMARPENLDRLLGEKPGKLRPSPSYSTTAPLSRATPTYSISSSSFTPDQLQPVYQSIRRSHYAHIHPQKPYNLSPTTSPPSNSFSLYSPCGQQPPADVPSGTESLNSPMAGKLPPVYGAAQHAEYTIRPRSTQDLLLEGDANYDIDTLNPSLTDLQLQGNLWEELREDSLGSEQNIPATTSSATFVSQEHHVQTTCVEVPSPLSHTLVGTAACHCKAGYEDEDTDRNSWNELHPVGYSGVESLAGYLTSCTTSISLV
ncbi:forkhead box protein N1 [Melanotaenia boesemani]|uniref:forkhead box protein N1 n=1 Tax=Melanotaenia boesemani TaxID=1250792 RepID=UPI001C04455D|nr:forkhead box protein N1 [Melanotaenia boesemani]XP_041851784.1 forkhead box protein N1 [Melanotaenia boesemani]